MDEKTGVEQNETVLSHPQSPSVATPEDSSKPEIVEETTAQPDDPPEPIIHGLRAKKPSAKRIVLKVLLRWLLTVALALAIMGVILYYSSQRIMSRSMKREFNSIVTGLSIALALALVSSLDGMVSELRWWVLSRRRRSRRKVEMILKVDSIVHLIMLASRSRRYSIHAAVTSWMIIVLLSQIGVAAVALCYSLDTAWRETLLYSGSVSVPNMTEIETQRLITSSTPSLGGQQFTANSYGTVSLAFTQGDMSDIPKEGTLWFPGDPLIFCNNSLCSYYFHDTSTESIISDAKSPVSITTLRHVVASTSCQSWPVTQGGNGSETSITVSLADGDQNVTLPFPIGIDVTAFMTNITENCGFGCSQLVAFEASDTQPWFYQCNSSVSQVIDGELPEHDVSDRLATMASRAIALQGDEISSLVNDTNFQYQMYPSESIFGTPATGKADYMGLIISRFAAGVVATSGQYNDVLNVTGMAPEIGEELNVKHPRIIAIILVLIVGVQLILDVVMAWVANRVVVPRRDVIAIAEVLRPMTIQNYEASKIPKRKRGSRKQKPESLWVYNYRKVSNDEYDLCMVEHKQG
ncbi:hypothetical protein HJFPF1_04034 [Paramyrothecium foliicola]|nr:hypothetical protein HJFPF1_04034 [Paramyrothecium foliicola]